MIAERSWNVTSRGPSGSKYRVQGAVYILVLVEIDTTGMEAEYAAAATTATVGKQGWHRLASVYKHLALKQIGCD